MRLSDDKVRAVQRSLVAVWQAHIAAFGDSVQDPAEIISATPSAQPAGQLLRWEQDEDRAGALPNGAVSRILGEHLAFQKLVSVRSAKIQAPRLQHRLSEGKAPASA